MNWFAFLSPDEGHGPDSARRNPGSQRRIPRDSEGHVRAFLPDLARMLQDYVATFNQSAADQLRLEVRKDGDGVEGIHLKFDGSGFEFRPTGKGAIQVVRFGVDGTKAYALLRPRTNRRGELLGWREQDLAASGPVLRRTAEELCETYLLHTVRSSLLTQSETTP